MLKVVPSNKVVAGGMFTTEYETLLRTRRQNGVEFDVFKMRTPVPPPAPIGWLVEVDTCRPVS